MFYEFPEDAECALLQDQYMFGGKYLVAPVMELGARDQEVSCLQAWCNVDTGEKLQGGGYVTVSRAAGLFLCWNGSAKQVMKGKPGPGTVRFVISMSKKWQMPLFRGNKFGQPEVARICKELILQAKSTTH